MNDAIIRMYVLMDRILSSGNVDSLFSENWKTSSSTLYSNVKLLDFFSFCFFRNFQHTIEAELFVPGFLMVLQKGDATLTQQTILQKKTMMTSFCGSEYKVKVLLYACPFTFQNFNVIS